MRILVTNDDSIYSPGIRALADIASEFGETRICAPDVEQSSMGHAISSVRPLTYLRTKIGRFEAFRVNGTPADCVALGAYHWGRVDLVLSGINLGINVGNSMWHSGTLAGAKQAALLKIRGIALSAPAVEGGIDFTPLVPFAHQAIELVLRDPALQLVNVNLPERPRGLRWTRQSVRQYDGKVVADEDPMGRPIFWFTAQPLKGTEEGTDRWAVEHGLVSLTPLRLDLTDEAMLAHVLREMPPA